MSIFGSLSNATLAYCSAAGANTQYVDVQDGLCIQHGRFRARNRGDPQSRSD